jgi:hypothetical protein
METVGATRRFFACGYEGGASGQFPSIKDRADTLSGLLCRMLLSVVGGCRADAVRRGYTK